MVDAAQLVVRALETAPAGSVVHAVAEVGVPTRQIAESIGRGIGVPVNLTESYRWFALAAANGDSDAAKKRDEVAARLDPAALATAKIAVQAFIPEREPDEATNLKSPPGGWDQASVAPVKPRRTASGAPTAR